MLCSTSLRGLLKIMGDIFLSVINLVQYHAEWDDDEFHPRATIVINKLKRKKDTLVDENDYLKKEADFFERETMYLKEKVVVVQFETKSFGDIVADLEASSVIGNLPSSTKNDGRYAKKRENVLVMLLCIIVGFIVGYVLHN
nr:uncharacterized protein LOC117280144 isoform X2 [Nicotiana tomentosiformis]